MSLHCIPALPFLSLEKKERRDERWCERGGKKTNGKCCTSQCNGFAEKSCVEILLARFFSLLLFLKGEKKQRTDKKNRVVGCLLLLCVCVCGGSRKLNLNCWDLEQTEVVQLKRVLHVPIAQQIPAGDETEEASKL